MIAIKETVSKIIRGLWGEELEDGKIGIPVIKTNNMSYEGKIDYSELTYRDIDETKIQDNYLQNGDLLIEKSGGTKTHSVGYVNIFEGTDNKYVCNNFILAIRPNKKIINPKYLFYDIQYKYNSGKFDDCYNKTTGIQNLKVDNYLAKKIQNIELEKQQEIVQNLDKINGTIDSKKLQLEALDEAIKSRFIEMFGDVLKNEKNWNTQSFKELCREIGDGLHGTPVYDDFGEYYFINGNNLENKSICIKNDTKRVSEEEYKKHFIDLDENTVLISINGTFGKTAFYNNEKIILGKSACYVKLKDELNREFVLNLFGTDAWLRYMDENSSGTTIRNFGLKAMREFKMIVPPLELQNEFATFVEQIDKSKFTIQQQIKTLQELLDKKMDEYFGDVE